jgi:hypothetical protein
MAVTSKTIRNDSDAQTEVLVQIAELLGDPLPADWQDPAAIEARQDHLAAVSGSASEAALNEITRQAERRQRGVAPTPDDGAAIAFATEMVALDMAIRRYTHDTQRGDALEIAYDAAEFMVGAGVATMVMGLVDRIRREGQASSSRASSSGSFPTISLGSAL